MSTVHIYSHGLVSCSVCAPASLGQKEVAAEVNRVNPTGISSRWEVSEENFCTGEDNPTPCEQEPDRFHWLLNC